MLFFQIVQTQIRGLLQETSDQGVNSLKNVDLMFGISQQIKENFPK